MPQRNMLLFVVLTMLLLAVYIPMRSKMQPPERPAEPAVKKEEEKKKKELIATQIPTQLPPTPEGKLVTMGSAERDSKFNLRVVVDPRGAGVRSVTLNKFRAADEDGRPLGDGAVLDLVPGEANEHEPSHLLFHFLASEKDLDARPVDTLGRRDWKVVEQNGQAVVRDEVEGKQREQVSLQTEIDGLTLTKTYSVVEGDYHVGLQVSVKRPKLGANAKASDKEPIKFRYQLTGAKGLPIEGKWYTGTFRNAMVAIEDRHGNVDRRLQELRQIDTWGGGSPVTVERDDPKGKLIRYAGVAVQYFASVIVVDENQRNQNFLRRATPSLETGVARGKTRDRGVGRAEYLVLTSEDGKTTTTIYLPPHLQDALMDVKENQQIAVIYRTLSYDESVKECPKVAIELRTGMEAQATHAMWEDDISVRVATEPMSLAPGDEETHSYLLYNGPVKPSLLRYLRGDREVDDALIERYANTLKLNTLTDYQSPGGVGTFAATIGWTWLVIKCTNLMHWVLGWLNVIVPSYGLSIIMLTLLVRMLMFPLSRKQTQMSNKMSALQPELKKLAAKHKDDRAAYAQGQMELFRKHGVNPLGSCWVLLLQMPIFMGLYFALQESIQFRLASFFPTWIVNLAAPDMLFEWGRNLPLISRDADYGGLLYLGPYLNLLPIFAVGLMVVQQKLMMPPPADKEQEMQQKMMKWMMIVMGLFFYKIAAGLCIYIITSTLWAFAERKLLPKVKPVGIDVDLDKHLAAAAAKVADVPASEAVTSPLGVVPSKKSLRNKRKAERGRKEEDKSKLGGFRQRLSDWWSDVLEQAKKK